MLIFSSALFSLSYYIMATFVGSTGNMCKIGAALTSSNIIFSLILSLGAGITLAGIIKLGFSGQNSIKSASVLGFSTFTGIFTIFCTLCTLPIISIAGLSIGLGFFTEYNNFFKLLSLILLFIGFYLIEKNLKKECIYRCKVK